MKSIVPLKLIITNDGNGTIVSAIFQYKVNNNGVIGGNVNSISVLASLSGVTFASLFSTAISQANISEGIS